LSFGCGRRVSARRRRWRSEPFERLARFKCRCRVQGGGVIVHPLLAEVIRYSQTRVFTSGEQDRMVEASADSQVSALQEPAELLRAVAVTMAVLPSAGCRSHHGPVDAPGWTAIPSPSRSEWRRVTRWSGRVKNPATLLRAVSDQPADGARVRWFARHSPVCLRLHGGPT
jgi:hypothetical protein